MPVMNLTNLTRETILKRIEELSVPGGPYNAYHLWRTDEVGGCGPYFDWTMEKFEIMSETELVNHFENIIVAAYKTT